MSLKKRQIQRVHTLDGPEIDLGPPALSVSPVKGAPGAGGGGRPGASRDEEGRASGALPLLSYARGNFLCPL